MQSSMPILKSDEEVSMVHSAVVYELKYDMNGKSDEDEIRKILKDSLESIQQNDDLIQWLNLEYKKKCSSFNWESLETLVTKQELQSISVSVEDIWFGDVFHEKVIINF